MNEHEIELKVFSNRLKKHPYNWMMMKYGKSKFTSLLKEVEAEAEDTFSLYLKVMERDMVQQAVERGNIATAEDIVDKHIGGEAEDTDPIDILEEELVLEEEYTAEGNEG